MLMLADVTEAASRSLQNPTPERLQSFVRKLVHDRLTDGQLDECELTFKDLDRICAAFYTVLSGAFHERIEYPEVVLPAKMRVPEGAGRHAAEKPAQEAPAPEPAPAPAEEPAPAQQEAQNGD